MKTLLAAAALAAAIATSAHAAITVDGTLDADYGATPTAYATHVDGTGTSNFATPNEHATDGSGYNIYLTAEAGNVYGYIQATDLALSKGQFANLYFDIDPANHNGSDIGFEINNSRGFVAGGTPNTFSPVNIQLYSDATTGVIEFAIPDTYFMHPLAGLESQYNPAQQFAVAGGQVVLRLSQTFGYALVGQPSNPDRLGAVSLSAVPEPASWSMMILGFLGAGGLLRARRRQVATA